MIFTSNPERLLTESLTTLEKKATKKMARGQLQTACERHDPRQGCSFYCTTAVGGRNSGKTTWLLEQAKALIAGGKVPDRIILVDVTCGDDDRTLQWLSNIRCRHWHLIDGSCEEGLLETLRIVESDRSDNIWVVCDEVTALKSPDAALRRGLLSALVEVCRARGATAVFMSTQDGSALPSNVRSD